MNHTGFQAPRHTISPPTGPQQIVSLPHLNIHVLPPGHPWNQDHSKILGRHRAVQGRPKKRGSKNPGSFLLLVNARSRFLSVLTNNPCSSHHVSTVRRASVWILIPYLWIFPPLEDNCHAHILENRHHLDWTLLSIHQQKGTCEQPPRYPDASWKYTDSCRGQPALQGSSNTSYDIVIDPMFSKCSTHGLIGGRVPNYADYYLFGIC